MCVRVVVCVYIGLYAYMYLSIRPFAHQGIFGAARLYAFYVMVGGEIFLSIYLTISISIYLDG